MPSRVRAALSVLFASLLLTEAVRAEDTYSDFERETLAQALEALGTEIDSEPDGKLIEAVEIRRLEVFDERDPVPDFFNVFHVTSREYVLRRELLFETGTAYDQRLVDESARNLRDVKQLSLVLLVPVRGSRPDRVRVLVITKDVWSLRLNSNFELAGDELTYLLLNPSEENVFGTHTSVGALFVLQPDTYSLGGVVTHPRVAGSRFRIGVSANAIFNRDTGDGEGSFGSFYYGQPLYSVSTRWAYEAAIVWRREITRRFIGLELRTYDALVTPADDAIPFVYDTDRLIGAYEVTRSFGRRFKFDVSGGVEADRRAYRTPELGGFAPQAVREFRVNEVPVSDTRISPFLQLRAYRTDYLRVLDFDTLGLQEDFRLGHEVLLRLYPASRAVGSTRDMLGTLAALSYTHAVGDGLVRVLGSSTIELEASDRHDATAEAHVRLVTPRLGLGRFVYDAGVLNRYQNYLNTRSVVGGSGRLRGYPPEFFIGDDVVASNLEFRTRPVQILSAEVGAALFYDAADAFDGFEDLDIKQSAGLGIRVLLPQVNRVVFRADWGFPLSPGYSTLPGALFVTFGQAFAVPQLRPPTVTDLFSRRVE